MQSFQPKQHPTWTEGAGLVAQGLRALVNDRTIAPRRASFAMLQSGHESRFGAGYGKAGAGSFQFGSITGIGPAGFFLHLDSSPGKAPEERQFRKYRNAAEGIADLIKHTNRPGVREAVARGSILDYAAALYGSGYYEGRYKDINPANASRNISEYAMALARFQPYLATAQFPPMLQEPMDPASAMSAWQRIFGPLPMRRYPAGYQKLAPALLTGPAFLTQPSQPSVASPSVSPLNPSPPADETNRNLVLSLRRLRTGETAAPGSFTTTYLGKGTYSAWTKT